MITEVDEPKKVSAGLKVADAVWVATAALHHRHPEAMGFSPTSIRQEVLASQLTDKDEKSVYQHIIQHLVATKAKDPNRRKMLTEVEGGQRRLYVPGDPVHPSKVGGQSTPKSEDLTPELRKWLMWYETWSKTIFTQQHLLPTRGLLEELTGTWTFGKAEDYLRELREGWD